MVDVNNVKEVLVALNMIGITLIKQLKDGFQVTDIGEVVAEIMGSAELKAALVAAVEGITAIPGEIADVSIPEGIELAVTQLEFLPKILAALKK